MLHKDLWAKLDTLDRKKTAKRAKCKYCPDSDRYILTMLNRQYIIDLKDKTISLQDSVSPLDNEFIEQLCILTYLINASKIPLAKKLVKAESLPGGEFFFRGQHILPTKKLEDVFARNCDLLYRAGQTLDAKKCDFGDASIELAALPSLPLTFVIWTGDDEFDPRASILFDKTAARQLPLDALLAAVNLTVDYLINLITK